MEYNARVVAGQKVSLTFNSTDQPKCPSHSADFCEGWACARHLPNLMSQYQAGKATVKGILRD
ncbi:MAG TPA: hypothetical protein VEH06_05380 [Candidatus Bathyarchaeia archaeon]|nr:hypothetical protein [Candidatus Bathyarchaeia archaeon]